MQSCRGLFVFILMLPLSGPIRMLAAESPETPPTAQQIYDRAQADFDGGDWPAAIKGLASIARPDKDGKMSYSQGIIHGRLARAYAHQHEIEAALREAGFALKGLAPEEHQERAATIAKHLSAALEKARAPAAARALALMEQPVGTGFSSWSAARVRMSASRLATLEQTDPQSAATAWLTLEYAIALEASGSFSEARSVLHRVLDYPLDVLGDHDPVRDVATLHLAALERRAGNADAADAKVKAAGLTRAQCLLFDVRPVITNSAVADANFPDEALRWKFDGYMREAFDIDAAGYVENVRTILAYPPFVFRSAAERSVARLRYLAPVVDGGVAGCDGHALNIHYQNQN